MLKNKSHLQTFLIAALCFFATSLGATTESFLPGDLQSKALELTKSAAQNHLRADLHPLLKESLKNALPQGSPSMRGSIRAQIGSMNFSSLDIDRAMVPFSTMNGPGLSPLFHDGGEWPGTGGNPDLDDGIGSGSNMAAEIYDVDGNLHYPKAVLRHIGKYCYIFLPVKFFPTLPIPLSSTQAETPPADPAWGKTWAHNPGLYIAPGSPGAVLEPRFIFGTDPVTARYNIAKLAAEFDDIIYKHVTEHLGSPPDIDNDSRIYILLDEVQDPSGSLLGYYWAGNQFRRNILSLSNEKELIYINIFRYYMNPAEVYSTIAHEFSHMVMFNEGYYLDQDNNLVSLETWLEEGITTFIEHLYTGKFSSNLDTFIRNPDTILVEPRSSVWQGNNPYPQYGASFLWTYYVAEKYAKGRIGDFLKTIIRAKAGGGIENYNVYFKQFQTDMATVFKDWTIANYLNKTVKSDGYSHLNDKKWGYEVDNDNLSSNDIGYQERLPVKMSGSLLLKDKISVKSGKVNPWAANYIEVSGNNGNLNVAFDGDDDGQFSVALIKKGPSVETDVEFMYLNDKQAGNLIVKNYGSNLTYQNLTIVPILHHNFNYNPISYATSASFDDLKVAVLPHPIFENNLFIILRCESKFSSAPKARITYGGTEGYISMTPVNDSTYIGDFEVKSTGEGIIMATGTNADGVIMENRLMFSAIYYQPQTQGYLNSSFASVRLSEKSLTQPGTVVLAKSDKAYIYPEIEKISGAVDLSLPGGKAAEAVEIEIPITAYNETVKFKGGLYKDTADGFEWLSNIDSDGNMAKGRTSVSGSMFIALDNHLPMLSDKITSKRPNIYSLEANDFQSGIKADSLKVLQNGSLLKASYEDGEIRIVTDDIENPVEIEISDNAANTVRKSYRLQAPLLPDSLSQTISWPNPAKTKSSITATFTGPNKAAASVTGRILDVNGKVLTERFDIPLKNAADGTYEYIWNLSDKDGRKVANGVYYAEIKASLQGNSWKKRSKIAVVR